nr:hypothetical protein Itr_chr08CG09560 [Ipomoea trifida]
MGQSPWTVGITQSESIIVDPKTGLDRMNQAELPWFGPPWSESSYLARATLVQVILLGLRLTLWFRLHILVLITLVQIAFFSSNHLGPGRAPLGLGQLLVPRVVDFSWVSGPYSSIIFNISIINPTLRVARINNERE